MLGKSIVRAARSFSTSAARSAGHGDGGIPQPGHNMPFQIENRYRLIAVCMLYFGSAAAFPFWVVKRGAEKE